MALITTAQYVTVANDRNGAQLGELIRLAITLEDRTTGLLDSRGLRPGEGLWLVPCSYIHMCGMKFPIDVVFLSADFYVSSMIAGHQPGNTGLGDSRAASVLELPSGTLDRTGTKPGDHLAFSFAPYKNAGVLMYRR